MDHAMRKFIKKRVFFATTPFLNAMKTQKIVATSVVAMALAMLGFGCGGDTGEKFEEIPLESIYVAGGGQPKVIHWGFDADGPYKEDLLRFLKLRPAASNIFLVRAKGEIEATGLLIKLEGRG